MDEGELRTALRELGRATLGTPAGHLRVSAQHLEARGVDVQVARRWVEAHGGHVERHEHRREGLGPNYGHLDVYVSLVVPEQALAD